MAEWHHRSPSGLQEAMRFHEAELRLTINASLVYAEALARSSCLPLRLVAFGTHTSLSVTNSS